MKQSIPQTIADYLDQLRLELRGADPAMIQDALHDAEEHLRAELADNPGRSEADMLAEVVSSYGAPAEVADIYREKDDVIQSALRPGSWMASANAIQRDESGAPRATNPTPSAPTRSWLARFFAVGADPRSYAALFYMLLSLATGIFYFTWVTVGLSLSAGFSILVIGLPFIVLFFGSVRALALVEGRLVETMLGVRMPRRVRYVDKSKSIWQRIGAMFTDSRTWLTLLYMLLMLPLGIAYFTTAVVGLSTALAFIFAPLLSLFGVGEINIPAFGEHSMAASVALMPLMVIAGVALLFGTLHLARGIAFLHGGLARRLLVDTPPV